MIFLVFIVLFKREPTVFLKPKVKYDVMMLFKFMFGKTDLENSRIKTSKKYREE